MPSDPSGVHPQGVLVRPAPDFFDDNMATGGAIGFQPAPAPGSTYWSVSLFNDSNIGTVFKVYGITASSEGGGGVGFFWKYGTVGTHFGPCLPIRPDVGNPYGQIYTQVVTGSAAAKNPFLTGTLTGVIAAGGFDSGTSLSPFPLFIVPVGWSLVGVNFASDNQDGCFFWYQIANE